jgi:hypothetical protein
LLDIEADAAGFENLVHEAQLRCGRSRCKRDTPARQEDLQEQFDSAIGREGGHGEQRHSDASTSTAIIKDYLATGKAHLVMEVTGVLKD